eukprot:2200793-Heterocapsa_arctica.AAC.1
MNVGVSAGCSTGGTGAGPSGLRGWGTAGIQGLALRRGRKSHVSQTCRTVCLMRACGAYVSLPHTRTRRPST